MKHIYRLSIRLSPEVQPIAISGVLGIQPTMIRSNAWELEIEESATDAPIDFVGYFLRIVGARFKQLESIGITRQAMTIWLLYEYDQQCNLEFTPDQLKRLGEQGIGLCVSCWAG